MSDNIRPLLLHAARLLDGEADRIEGDDAGSRKYKAELRETAAQLMEVRAKSLAEENAPPSVASDAAALLEEAAQLIETHLGQAKAERFRPPPRGSALLLGNAPPSGFRAALSEEISRARAKFPGNALLLAALTEEVGELAQALLQEQGEARVRAEAVQVACVAQRIWEEGDATFASDKGANRQLPPETKRLHSDKK